MSQSDQSVNAFQLRIVLRRTSPHLWRRVVVGSDSTLSQLHQTVQALFGWTDSHPHRFVLRGRSLSASSMPAAAALSAPDLRLFEFKLLLKVRFFYDYRFHDADVPIWRHEIRFEKALVADPERVPCCIGGVGNPPLEQSGSPQELSTLAELFTPPFVLHQLTELIDRGSSDAELAQQLRYLRPWLTADRFSRKQANQQLQASLGGAQ
jgi:hypothetical protein